MTVHDYVMAFLLIFVIYSLVRKFFRKKEVELKNIDEPSQPAVKNNFITFFVCVGVVLLVVGAFYLKIVFNNYIFHDVFDLNIFHKKDIKEQLIFLAIVMLSVFIWQKWLKKEVS